MTLTLTFFIYKTRVFVYNDFTLSFWLHGINHEEARRPNGLHLKKIVSLGFRDPGFIFYLEFPTRKHGVTIMDTPLKTTPLSSWHENSGARMAGFAGWNMPIQYKEGIIAETLYTRQAVTCFDICHMGEFLIKGSPEESGLERIITVPVNDIPPGSCRYGSMLNKEGGVMDDLIVYRKKNDEWMIVVNAGTRQKDAENFKKNLSNRSEFADLSEKTGKIDLQGPLSRDILKNLCPQACGLSYYNFMETELMGEKAIVSRTGYTGELGFEFYFPRKRILDLWQNILSDKRVKPAGLGSRDILRLEMGYSLYGQDIDEKITPLEGGLERYVDFKKDFIGKEALLLQKRAGIPRSRIFFRSLSRRSPRHLQKIYRANGPSGPIGEVTSGSFSPHIECGIGMGFVKGSALAQEQTILIGDENMKFEAVVCGKPFLKKTSLKI